MSTKHNCPHPNRGRSHYQERLSRRGLSKSPVMERVETLRVRQLRRAVETGAPFWTGGNENVEDAA